MASSDLSNSKFLLLTLLVAVGILGYYYYDASSMATSLFNDAERLQLMWRNANKTIADMRRDVDECQAQMRVLEFDRNKLKTDGEAKDKVLNEKAAAEKKTNEDAAKLKTEKESFEKTAKETQDKLDKCNKDCEDKVKKAQDDCAATKQNPAAAAAPAANAPATS